MKRHATVGEVVGPSQTLFVVADTRAVWITGAVYPQGWTIKVPKQDLEVKVTPVQADQELHQGMSNHHKYWEGLCDVSGTRARKPISGRAYVELTGYVP